eukprot:TRINITY_DN3094_c0_g1_i3.p1 TRINITY_DN3094_c0_g1~~TRINITY_DN3094_c0_g1_i3.p1  ORF type:complete len:271 (-),score=42.86 TRINITY_DN3094_c0_g1_i3:150-962(-)
MAHGNASDMVFFALVAIVVQWFAYPATLFEDIGPLKAQFTAQTTDMNTAIKFGGGLLLAHGLTLSGVSWNPKNGKMAGFGGFIVAGHTAYSTFKADSDVFVPRLFYVYAAVIFLGALHVFLFPSNPSPPKTPESKNNHGNASDFAFFALLGASTACIFYPEHLFQDIGPLKAQFNKQSADLAAMIKFVGGMMLMMGLTLSGVKWNPINGKMAGIGGFICSGYTAYSVFKADNDVFVPRVFYLYAAIIFFGALHIFAFPSNPLIAKADKKD